MTGRRATQYGKTLPFEEAASIYTARQIKVRDDVTALHYVELMLDWGMHPKLITEISGLPKVTLARLISREGGGVKGGAPSKTLGPIITSIPKHLQANMFLSILKNYVDRVERVITAWSFIEAFSLTRAATKVEHLKLTGDEAYNVVAKGWAQKTIASKECGICHSPYISSVAAVVIHGSPTHGDCPLCRSLSSMPDFTPVQITQASQDRSRSLLQSYLGGNATERQP